MAVRKAARPVIAGFAVIVIIAAALLFVNRGNVDTRVVLDDDQQGGCLVRDKEPEVRIKKDKKLTWVINSTECDNKDELVTVGNFRRQLTSTAPDCREATEGRDVLWPFKEGQELTVRQHTSKIELHTKTLGELPDEILTYYYDICTGANADRKSDPLLVIEK